MFGALPVADGAPSAAFPPLVTAVFAAFFAGRPVAFTGASAVAAGSGSFTAFAVFAAFTAFTVFLGAAACSTAGACPAAALFFPVPAFAAVLFLAGAAASWVAG
ncbi:hypothetical protein [Longispora albida]|uniref:hypothetical protein n=1 Tax=Longispora albida TaxID=203523 RepID=UPI0012F8B64A|nr:hypothetical protein [Longispora albida]